MTTTKGDRRINVCPKDPRNHYFAEVCETVFRTSKFRPWCEKCAHLTPNSSIERKEMKPKADRKE